MAAMMVRAAIFVFFAAFVAGFSPVRAQAVTVPSSIPRGRGGRVHLVISELARGHTLIDVVIVDQTRVDLVTRVAFVP